ncbi:hypothetical protein SNEBB_002018 [Seison nebaliae]|nr:hypothetical protein SNEBB_002018 [Seison nebaliae]
MNNVHQMSNINEFIGPTHVKQIPAESNISALNEEGVIVAKKPCVISVTELQQRKRSIQERNSNNNTTIPSKNPKQSIGAVDVNNEMDKLMETINAISKESHESNEKRMVDGPLIASSNPSSFYSADNIHKRSSTAHNSINANSFNSTNSTNLHSKSYDKTDFAPIRPKLQKEETKKKHKRILRASGVQVWEDAKLNSFDPDDYRLFCGDIGNEVTDEMLAKAFGHYQSYKMARVVRDPKTNKTRGYAFISFGESIDMIRAMREMDGKYVGNRPIKLKKSTWRERNLENVQRKMKQKLEMGLR